MLSQHDLQQLASHQGSDVLSLYINLDPTRQTTEEYRLALRHLLASVNGRAAAEDVSRIERYFDHEYDRSGRGVALFSAQRSNLWHTFSFSLPITDRITVGRKPYLAPLLALWDTYSNYGVALVDRLGSKFLHYQMGELVSIEGTLGEEVRTIKTGRGSSVVGQRGGLGGHVARRVAEVVRRNVKESAAGAAAFFAAHQCKQIAIGGSDEVVSEFIDELPEPWPNRLAGTFPAAIDMPEAELREVVHGLLAEAARRREHDLADKVVTAAAKGANGVIRLDDTLSAAQDGRIQTLLVSDGYEALGYRCSGCGYLTTQPLAQCPFCSGTFEAIPYAVDEMIAQVITQGGDVKVIHDHSPLKEAGVAALLRY